MYFPAAVDGDGEDKYGEGQGWEEHCQQNIILATLSTSLSTRVRLNQIFKKSNFVWLIIDFGELRNAWRPVGELEE